MKSIEHDKRKPWRSPAQQVEQLKEHGVKFQLISEQEATLYLTNSNNYFRLRSYRKEFPKVSEGKRKGQYVNLDFKMLVDLSIIDMLLRKILLPMAIDVEHFAKVSLLAKLDTQNEDGYAIVQDFINEENAIEKEILRGRSSVYVDGIIEKYPIDAIPVWAFLEVISFGAFCRFYFFCSKRFDDKSMSELYYQLMDVKNFRNACAHNNCVLNDLRTNEPAKTTSLSVTQALADVPGIGKSQRKRKMRNVRLRQIVTTLFVHKKLATDGVMHHSSMTIATLVKRMNKHIDYYKGVDSVSSTFGFLTKVMEYWYPFNESEKTCLAHIDDIT